MSKITQCLCWLDKGSYAISRFFGIFTGVLIALVAAMIGFYVLNRATFGFKWLFVEEWTSLAMVAISYLGLGYTLRRGRHIYVDVVLRTLSERKQLVCGVIASVVCMLVIGCMLERSLDLLSYNFARDVRSTGPLRTPLWIPTLAMNVGLFVCLIDFVFFFFDRLLRLFQHESGGLNFFSE